jgi:hypothetical protein
MIVTVRVDILGVVGVVLEKRQGRMMSRHVEKK